MGMLSPAITLRGVSCRLRSRFSWRSLFRIDRVLDQDQRPVDGERLFQKIVGAQLGGADRGLNGPMAGDHDDFRSIFTLANSLQGLEAVHAGQPYVEQHYIKGAFAHGFKAGFAAFGDENLVAFILQHAFERLADAGFIIHDEDVMHAAD